MPNLNAALGLAQIEKINHFIKISKNYIKDIPINSKKLII